MVYGILHNIRSAHNVGSIFRSADGAGLTKLFLTGYTPAPVDRFGRRQPEIAKTSLGASESVSWEAHPDVSELLAALTAEGFVCIGVEQHPRAVAIDRAHLPESVAYVFGNERDGLPDDVVAATDMVVDIPMYGTKASLNVSVAAGIVFFTHRHRRPQGDV